MDRSSRAEAAAAPGTPVGGARTRRQEQVLDGLEEIFREEGFRRLTIGELATRLRCSRSTLYAMAPTKEEGSRLAWARTLPKAALFSEGGRLVRPGDGSV